VQVRFGGLDEPVVDGAPKFMKSLTIDHARDGEDHDRVRHERRAASAFERFPPEADRAGWCAVYWIKMLNDIEVLDQPDIELLDDDRLRYPTRRTPLSNRVKKASSWFRVTRNLPDPSSRTSSRATLCRPVRRRRRVASPSEAIAAWRMWIVDRWRQELEIGSARHGRRQIWLPTVASSVHLAVAGRADADDPLHQHQRRNAAGVPGLEIRRATCAIHRIDPVVAT